MDKKTWNLLRDIPKIVPYTTTPDAKWGTISIGVSIVFFFIPTALAFWAIQISLDGGEIVLPSNPASWVFFCFAILAFICAIVFAVFVWRMAWRWYSKSGEAKSSSQELSELQKHLDCKFDQLQQSIDDLVTEIRQERNERNNKQKPRSI